MDLSNASVHVLTYDKQAEGLTNGIAPDVFQNPIGPPQSGLKPYEVRI